MRYAVVSDVHGNLSALRATVARLRGAGVDAWLCAGDIVGYGPEPEACVETLADLGAMCVAGNHELALLDRLPEDRVGALARETLHWSRSVLSPDAVAFLDALPLTMRAGDLVMTHGSLNDPTEYVTSDRVAAQQLDRLAQVDPSAGVLVLGHTHRARAYVERGGARSPRGEVSFDEGGRVLLNPGSVGQSRQWEVRPRARSLIVDLGRRRAEFFAVDYDVDATLAELRRHGFPRACLHHPRNPVRAARHRVARLAPAALSKAGAKRQGGPS